MPKVLPFEVPKKATESFRVQVDDVPFFYDTLHKHPEIQITYIYRGSGMAYCGDYLDQFKEDELYVLGPDQPHLFKCSKFYYKKGSPNVYSVSLFFDKDSLGAGFFQIPEAADLEAFIERSQRGMVLKGEEAKDFYSVFREIRNLEGSEKLLAFLTILQRCAESEGFVPLAKQVGQSTVSDKEGKRMNDVIQFTLAEYYRNVELEEVAQVAKMTKQAFCRFFKKRTRKTYFTFLNETRVANACIQLEDLNYSIVQVAYQCGYNNLSNFNRMFKRITGRSPSEYRKLKTRITASVT